MIIFINNKSAKNCQITLCIKKFIHKRKVVPFLLPCGVDFQFTVHLLRPGALAASVATAVTAVV